MICLRVSKVVSVKTYLVKRVDYSGRSVIVVGPKLKLNECGLPKAMASELFKPFIIRKLIERGIVKTVKSAKKIVDKKDPIIWDILENILKAHPVMLNRAPTLHRLGIQAFQPKLVEGKAIRLHPLTCTGFNADFDGDQMAVHVPLSNAAVLEAQLLMLAPHNILNPANGSPIMVPSQDMVLGLYYITKGRKSSKEHPVQGEGIKFYSPEEVIIAHNEKKADLHAIINVKVMIKQKDDTLVEELIETTVGRVIFNTVVPQEFGFVNQTLTKKSLRDIIANMVRFCGVAVTSKFLDEMKGLGFHYAFKGGLSFNLSDVHIPDVKIELVAEAKKEVEEIWENYNMGVITNNERYNQVIDVWTKVNSRISENLMNHLKNDDQGFNPIYMMLDSGARGSREQIRQLGGMRGLMAKPQKNLKGGTGEIIENPILSNFKEGLSVLEYFISTHGARKGLADTALKTADAGYLTRRLHDVAQDVVIMQEDCGTLRGVTMTPLKDNDEIVEPIYERILGRTVVYDIVDPNTGETLAKEGAMIDEEIAQSIQDAEIEEVQIRSVLTCEIKRGVCAKCYGRNLARGHIVKKGESVGVIAAQSIGEPGTQLTLRTFHTGGTASSIASESQYQAKFAGIINFDQIKTIETEADPELGAETGTKINIVTSRSGEIRIIEPKTKTVVFTANIPYASQLFVEDGQKVKKGDQICKWDPFNAFILTDTAGKVSYEGLVENINFREEIDDQTGRSEKVMIETKDKKLIPIIRGNC